MSVGSAYVLIHYLKLTFTHLLELQIFTSVVPDLSELPLQALILLYR